MTPLIFITNDDGYLSRGLRHLADTAKEFGDVVVVAPESNASGLSTSITCAPHFCTGLRLVIGS